MFFEWLWTIFDLRFGLLAKFCAGRNSPDLQGRLGGECLAESECCLIYSVNRRTCPAGEYCRYGANNTQVRLLTYFWEISPVEMGPLAKKICFRWGPKITKNIMSGPKI